MKIKLNGIELPLDSASIEATMDTGADEWTCSIPWEYGQNPGIDEAVWPRSLANAVVSIGKDRLITGYKYITDSSLADKSLIRLTGYSRSFALIMSNPKVAKSFIEASLLDIAKDLCAPFSLSVGYGQNTEDEVNEIFTDQITIEAQDTVFGFLANLAKQRGVLLDNDIYGNPYFTKAYPNQRPMAFIEEGVDGKVVPAITDNFTARFDDTQAFQTYQAVNDSPFAFVQKDPPGLSKDPRIKVPSFKTVVYNSLNDGEGKRQIDFTRNKTIAQSLSIPFQTNDWYAPNGNLWKASLTVSLKSPSIFVPNGFTFLIRAVQYNYSQQGRTAVLKLVPPKLYTGEEIDEPWA